MNGHGGIKSDRVTLYFFKFLNLANASAQRNWNSLRGNGTAIIDKPTIKIGKPCVWSLI